MIISTNGGVANDSKEGNNKQIEMIERKHVEMITHTTVTHTHWHTHTRVRRIH